MRSRVLAVVLPALALGFVACGWDPSHPFDRDAPPVKSAIKELGDGGDAGTAADLLQTYLDTGGCSPEGNIGTPPKVRDKSNASFDLGLALFRIGEAYGTRFGDEEVDAGGTPELRAQRVAQVDCARRVVTAIAEDASQPIDLRARARYLEGNLHFLLGEYEEAVSAYDKALTLAPGFPDGGDEVGRDAAWNRALAQKRIQDKKDAGSDGGNDGGGDASSDGGGNDGGGDASGDGGGNDGGGDAGGNDGGKDAGDGGGNGGNDGGSDAGQDGGNQGDAGNDDKHDAGPPPPRQTQDDRMLDRLENAPTFQHEAARKAAGQRRVSGSLDK